jgi:hypothetical protein
VSRRDGHVQERLRHAFSKVFRFQVKQSVGGKAGIDVRLLNVRIDVVIHGQLYLVAPSAGTCRAEQRGRWSVRRLGGLRVTVHHAHDQCVRSPVEEILEHRKRHRTVGGKAAENALVIGETEDAHRTLLVGVYLPAQRTADECRDRGGHTGYRVHTAGDLFDVYAWIRKGRGHVSSCLIDLSDAWYRVVTARQ